MFAQYSVLSVQRSQAVHFPPYMDFSPRGQRRLPVKTFKIPLDRITMRHTFIVALSSERIGRTKTSERGIEVLLPIISARDCLVRCLHHLQHTFPRGSSPFDHLSLIGSILLPYVGAFQVKNESDALFAHLLKRSLPFQDTPASWLTMDISQTSLQDRKRLVRLFCDYVRSAIVEHHIQFLPLHPSKESTWFRLP
eukprot:TRINITY_DN10610_c0_g1_i1.p1 TRINITY_DN10610_c0_g1~~TRINITY_DN10610_c0_g1_i1.p1  ORF type:complete len:195 (-),score=10.83 TRINITY_DN10610_c0_g1_i1:3-587(-)